jgi:hypothetical protein
LSSCCIHDILDRNDSHGGECQGRDKIELDSQHRRPALTHEAAMSIFSSRRYYRQQNSGSRPVTRHAFNIRRERLTLLMKQ